MPTVELHVLGLGDAPDKLIRALMDDQLRAYGFEPLKVLIHRIEGTQAIGADLVLLWTGEYDGLDVEVCTYRDTNSFSEEFGHRLWGLAPNHAKMLVFWDESRTTKWAVQVSLDLGFEVWSLTETLAEIESITSEDNNERTQPEMAKKSIYTEEQLKAMEEEEITGVAESFGIDHGNIPTWDEVIELILDAQGDESESNVESESVEDESEPAAGDEPEGDDDEGGDEFVPYTRPELEAMELDTLKQICAENGIEVEGQRPRLRKYVDAILEAQGGEPEDSESQPAPETKEKASRPAEAASGTAFDTEAFANEVVGALSQLVEAAQAQIIGVFNEGLNRIVGRVAGLEGAIQRLDSGGVTSKEEEQAQTNGNVPTKSAPAVKAAAPVRKMARPKS